MAGGIGRVRRDHVQHCIERRLRYFGVERVTLSRSLTLLKADEELNRTAKRVAW